jgi:hypothetical protein
VLDYPNLKTPDLPDMHWTKASYKLIN